MKKLITFGLLFLIFIVGFFVYDETKHKNEVAEATKNVESSSVQELKASLDYYYVLEGEYPRNTEDLVKVLSRSEKNKEIIKALPIAIKSLKDFTFTVRGDEQAYKFTYTNSNGKQQVVEGNYKKDFH